MIRKAAVSDAARIAEIDVAGSRFAYKDIVPESYLYGDLVVENRIPAVRNWIEKNMFDVFVHEDPESGVIKGMMGFGPCGDADKPNAFELHFLYVEPVFSRAGIGSGMIRFFEQSAREKGFSELVIWVLEENRIGIGCYLKHGYHPDGAEKIFKRLNKKEVRYIKAI